MSKNDVNIVVRARDEASKKFGKVGRSAGGMGLALKAAAAAAAVYFGARAMLNFGKDATAAFGVQEMAVNHLTSALDNLGKGGPKVMKEMKGFAGEIQKITTVGDEATLEMMSMGASMGKLAGDDLKKATVAAIGLSKAYKMDVTAAMRLVARASAGDTASLARYGIKLDTSMNTQEKFNEVLRIGADNFKLATDETDTSTGRMKQWGNTWGDIKEKIGGWIMSMVMKIAGGFKTMGAILGTFKVNFAGVGSKIAKVGGFIKGIIKGLATIWIYELTFIETVIGNWKESFRIAGVSIHLAILQIAGNIKHFFTSVIPELLRWFKDNWKEVFVSIWRGTKAIIKNIWKNLTDFWQSTKDLFSGKGFTFKWTGLLDGFESAVKEMPKIIGREISGKETELKKQLASLAGNLGKDFQANLKPRLALLESGSPTKEKESGLAALGLSGGATGGGTAAGTDAAAGKKLSATESRFLTMKAGAKLTPTDKNTATMVDLLKQMSADKKSELSALKGKPKKERLAAIKDIDKKYSDARAVFAKGRANDKTQRVASAITRGQTAAESTRQLVAEAPARKAARETARQKQVTTFAQHRQERTQEVNLARSQRKANFIPGQTAQVGQESSGDLLKAIGKLIEISKKQLHIIADQANPAGRSSQVVTLSNG